MKDAAKNSNFLPFKLDKHQKKTISAFAFPFILALNCVFMQVYLGCQTMQEFLDDKERRTGFHIDLDPIYFSPLPFLQGICGNNNTSLFYFWLGVFFYFFLGLSIMLPILLYLRRRPVEKAALFE